jgi:hypothetical protein
MHKRAAHARPAASTTRGFAPAPTETGHPIGAQRAIRRSDSARQAPLCSCPNARAIALTMSCAASNRPSQMLSTSTLPARTWSSAAQSQPTSWWGPVSTRSCWQVPGTRGALARARAIDATHANLVLVRGPCACPHASHIVSSSLARAASAQLLLEACRTSTSTFSSRKKTKFEGGSPGTIKKFWNNWKGFTEITKALGGIRGSIF